MWRFRRAVIILANITLIYATKSSHCKSTEHTWVLIDRSTTDLYKIATSIAFVVVSRHSLIKSPLRNGIQWTPLFYAFSSRLTKSPVMASHHSVVSHTRFTPLMRMLSHRRSYAYRSEWDLPSICKYTINSPLYYGLREDGLLVLL
jgi:hypothetical protein